MKAGTATVDHRCAVQDRPPLWISELAEAQGPRRFTRGDRAAQAGDRHQRSRARQEPHDPKPGAAPAPLGYGKNGPLTWVAECRVPWEPPSPARLAMAKWMIENGSDVHQGGDGPLMRAALNGDRIPMMELLVSYGADVNAEWNGDFPIIFAPCEAVDPEALKWLLDHGANPNCDNAATKVPRNCAGLRHRDLRAFTRATERLHRRSSRCGRHDEVQRSRRIGSAPSPARSLSRATRRRFRAWRTGGFLNWTAAARAPAASCFRERPCCTWPRSSAMSKPQGCCSIAAQTSTRAPPWTMPASAGKRPFSTRSHSSAIEGYRWRNCLVERGADLEVRVKLPGHYERPDEVVECTPLGYALRFQNESHSEGRTIAFLRERGAIE